MTGTEYILSEVLEPNLFVIRKQKRDGPEKVTPMLTYYILDGSIYQAPQLCNVFASRVVSISSTINFLVKKKLNVMQLSTIFGILTSKLNLEFHHLCFICFV